MSLASDLWNQHQSLAQACLHHPFVQGIADGTLPKAKFAYYVGQDAFFLDAFARAYSICAAKAPTLESFQLFHQLAGGVLEERQLHYHYAKAWGVDLTQVSPGITTRRYVDFLSASAWSQAIGLTATAMAPCMRLYAYLGQALTTDGIPDHGYRDWLTTYREPLFEDLAQQLEHLLDQYAAPWDGDRLQATYGYAMQCELDFFQAAWEAHP